MIKINYSFDLKLFGEEKTEQATAKKKRDSRNKGQVVQSKDITATVILLSVVVTIYVLRNYLYTELCSYVLYIFGLINETDNIFYKDSVVPLFVYTIQVLGKIIMPILGVAFIVSFAITYIQVGSLFTTDPIIPKLSKINPIEGLKNLFSLKSLVELVKAVLKASILLYIAYSYIEGRSDEVLILFQLEVTQIMVVMFDFAFGVTIRCSIALFVIAVFDLIYKIWKNNKDLMMTKQEIKDEYKQSEGDPKLKAKIKQKQREFATNRMMQDVPKADVVITNPTHFAVAIQYDTDLAQTPRVIAKGQDLIAQNIKRIAKENGIIVVENKPLARKLFSIVEVGQFIPPDLYEAVAEVLAYVYGLKK